MLARNAIYSLRSLPHDGGSDDADLAAGSSTGQPAHGLTPGSRQRRQQRTKPACRKAPPGRSSRSRPRTTLTSLPRWRSSTRTTSCASSTTGPSKCCSTRGSRQRADLGRRCRQGPNLCAHVEVPGMPSAITDRVACRTARLTATPVGGMLAGGRRQREAQDFLELLERGLDPISAITHEPHRQGSVLALVLNGSGHLDSRTPCERREGR